MPEPSQLERAVVDGLIRVVQLSAQGRSGEGPVEWVLEQ
jgi:hypothetical protein